MFGKRIDLFKLLGFQVRIDFSWIIIAVLIAWSLSTGLFPIQFEGLSTQTYWIMGIVGAKGRGPPCRGRCPQRYAEVPVSPYRIVHLIP